MAEISRIDLGQTRQVLDESTSGAGTSNKRFTASSDSILISLFCSSLTSGTLSVSVYTYTKDGEETEIITFPELSAPTSELVLKKAALTMSNVEVRATYTGECDYSVYVRGISTGEASVRLLGANDASASQISVGTTPIEIIPSSLTDRAGLVVKNYSTSGTLFIGHTAAEAADSVGYPLEPGEAMGVDLASGVSIYGKAGSGTIDVRIMQAGS